MLIFKFSKELFYLVSTIQIARLIGSLYSRREGGPHQLWGTVSQAPTWITLAGVPSFLNNIDKLPGRGQVSSRDGLLSLARTLLPPSPGPAAPAVSDRRWPTILLNDLPNYRDSLPERQGSQQVLPKPEGQGNPKRGWRMVHQVLMLKDLLPKSHPLVMLPTWADRKTNGMAETTGAHATQSKWPGGEPSISCRVHHISFFKKNFFLPFFTFVRYKNGQPL